MTDENKNGWKWPLSLLSHPYFLGTKRLNHQRRKRKEKEEAIWVGSRTRDLGLWKIGFLGFWLGSYTSMSNSGYGLDLKVESNPNPVRLAQMNTLLYIWLLLHYQYNEFDFTIIFMVTKEYALVTTTVKLWNHKIIHSSCLFTWGGIRECQGGGLVVGEIYKPNTLS